MTTRRLLANQVNAITPKKRNNKQNTNVKNTKLREGRREGGYRETPTAAVNDEAAAPSCYGNRSYPRPQRYEETYLPFHSWWWTSRVESPKSAKMTVSEALDIILRKYLTVVWDFCEMLASTYCFIVRPQNTMAIIPER